MDDMFARSARNFEDNPRCRQPAGEHGADGVAVAQRRGGMALGGSLTVARHPRLRRHRFACARARRSRTISQPKRPTGPAISVSNRKGNCTARLKPFRSEEHTSELQSLMRISYAVFCLKKKNIIK